MNYKKYSDEEILESYNTMIDYSGKVDDQIKVEIESRGGLEQVEKNASERSVVPNEIRRINNIVFSLYKEDPSAEAIKNSVTSDILSSHELNLTVDSAIERIKSHVKDTSINSRTIIGSILGVIISSLVGAGLWCYSIIQTGKMYYILTGVILIISYIVIRVLTKQSKNNALVFIATFVSAATAILLGLWFYKLIST